MGLQWDCYIVNALLVNLDKTERKTHRRCASDAKRIVGTHEFAESTNEGYDFMRSDAAFCVGSGKSCPSMLAVSYLWLVIDAAVMVKKDLNNLMFPSTSST